MSLREEIDESNKNKENIKKCRNEINNSLLEVAGVNANNLKSVPDKLQIFINEAIKVAEMDVDYEVHWDTYNGNMTENTLYFPKNLEFNPKRLIILYKTDDNRYYGADSSLFNGAGSLSHMYVYLKINRFDNEKVVFIPLTSSATRIKVAVYGIIAIG